MPLDDVDSARLVTFVENGGGLFLTGERPCCEDLNQADGTIVNLVEPSMNVQVGGLGDVCNCNSPLPINATAVNGVATRPFTLTTWTPAYPGGLSNVATSNIFSSYADGSGGAITTGAIWGQSQTVGGGRLAILMDVNWLEPTWADETTAPQVAQNLALFLSGLNSPPSPPPAAKASNAMAASDPSGSAAPSVTTKH
jgi:hypothetical protein